LDTPNEKNLQGVLISVHVVGWKLQNLRETDFESVGISEYKVTQPIRAALNFMDDRKANGVDVRPDEIDIVNDNSDVGPALLGGSVRVFSNEQAYAEAVQDDEKPRPAFNAKAERFVEQQHGVQINADNLYDSLRLHLVIDAALCNSLKLLPWVAYGRS
jgi:hypothetical protein